MGEKLVVEFDVEKTNKLDFGYEEKYLKRFNEKLPYKAIVKDGKFVAIVSRRYKLIQHELIEQALQDKIEDTIYDGWRRHWVLKGDGVKAMVHNSVDGSLALKVSLLIRLDNGSYAVFTQKEEELYRKHTKNIDTFVEQLNEVVDKVVKNTEEYKTLLADLRKAKAKDYIKQLEIFTENMPKVYVKDVMFMVKRKDKDYSLYDIYALICRRIWASSRAGFRTKLELFKKLNLGIFGMIDSELPF